MIGVAILWFLVGCGVGFYGGIKLMLQYIEHGPIESVRKMLWEISQIFIRREDHPAEQHFVCTNDKCEHRGMAQCPICGVHYDLDDDEEEDEEDAPAQVAETVSHP